jgi:hypothetical protein
VQVPLPVRALQVRVRVRPPVRAPQVPPSVLVPPPLQHGGLRRRS